MIGNYFKTGKTIVIDDQYEEAKPLLKSLYKHQIPHYYSDGRPNSDDFPLPDEKLHFRLIFLDLNLQLQSSMGSSDSDEFKNFKTQHLGILERILKNDNHSYLLVIWSQEEEKYKEHFEKIFDPAEKYHTTKKPYRVLSLSKPDFFNQGKFIEGKEEELYAKIQTELENLDTYKLFCEWERIVNESAGETFDTIFQLVNGLEDTEKEEYLKKLITLLSVAYSGDEGYLNLTDDQMKTDSVLLALNQILNDDIDRLILDQRQEEYKNWFELKSAKDISNLRKAVDRGLINAKLFTYSPNKPELTGSVYKLGRSNMIEKIFNESLLINDISASEKKKLKEEHGKKYQPTDEEMEKLVSKKIEQIYSSIIPIELNITPICDVSQGKDILHRVIPGFIIGESYKMYIKTHAGFSKSTEIFKLNSISEKENILLYFDIRFFTTVQKEEIQKRVKDRSTLPKYLFTLRGNLVNDFQIEVANHISRLGVLLLQEG